MARVGNELGNVGPVPREKAREAHPRRLSPEGPATSLGTDHIDCTVKITLITTVQARQAQLRRNPDEQRVLKGSTASGS